jgi:hypothetical protein
MIVPGMSGMIDGAAGDHIQISPPYVLTEAHVDRLVVALETAIQGVMRELSTQGRHRRGQGVPRQEDVQQTQGVRSWLSLKAERVILGKERGIMASGQDARFAEEQYLRHIMIEWEDPRSVAAIVVGPISNTGGIIAPPMEYLSATPSPAPRGWPACGRSSSGDCRRTPERRAATWSDGWKACGNWAWWETSGARAS